MAKKIGKTVATVSDYEKGRSLPPLDITVKLCELFQVTLDDLVNEDLTTQQPGPAANKPESARAGATDEDQELLRRFLVLKLEEVANTLKEEQPELYERLRLGDLIKKEKNF